MPSNANLILVSYEYFHEDWAMGSGGVLGDSGNEVCDARLMAAQLEARAFEIVRSKRKVEMSSIFLYPGGKLHVNALKSRTILKLSKNPRHDDKTKLIDFDNDNK